MSSSAIVKLNRNKRRSLDFYENPEDFRTCLMGALGYSLRFIIEETGLSANQVQYRLRKSGTRLRDYRNGNTVLAKRVLSRSEVAATKEVRKQMKQLKLIA